VPDADALPTWDAIWQRALTLADALSTAGSNWQPLTPQLDSLAHDFGALELKHPEAKRHLPTLVQMLGDAGGKTGPGRDAVKGYLTEGAWAVKRAAAIATRAERAAPSEAELLYEVHPGADTPIDLAAASALLQENADRLAFYARQFWLYDAAGGYWAPADGDSMGRLAIALLRRCYATGKNGDLLFRFGTAADTANTLQQLQRLASPGPLDRPNPPAVIAFHNSTYDLAAAALVAHSPQHGATFAVDAPWRGLQTEPPPVLLAFVERCYGVDALPCVRALIRSAIDPTVRYGEAWHLLGDSHSGKGILLALAVSLLPSKQVSALEHPCMLETPEKVSQYAVGRRLITFPDCPHHVPRNYSGHPANWYQLVMNEIMTARRLNSNETWEGLLYARSIICSTAHLQFGKGRDGFTERILILPTLPRTGPKDPTLKASLIGNTPAHQLLRGDLAGWALAMPLEEVNAVLDRNDPGGILQGTATDLARVADHPSRWADEALIPHLGGPQAEVTEQEWHLMFTCYLAWCKARNIRNEGSVFRFQGEIRTVLTTARCLSRGKGPRPERRDLPSLDVGFQLRLGLMKDVGYGAPVLERRALQAGGLEAIAALPPVQRPPAE
jgi:hypothetical protein